MCDIDRLARDTIENKINRVMVVAEVAKLEFVSENLKRGP